MDLSVFLLLARPSAKGREFEASLRTVLEDGRLETFADIGDLETRLRGPKGPSALSIIWDPDPQQLRAIETRRDLFSGARLLLVLPDDAAETVALAHRLRPAYITYVEEGIPDVVAVLGRLAEGPRSGGTSEAR
jgi:hypothetical protein